MELKTKISAADKTHTFTITREFDLPLELLFRAYSDAEIVKQWMNTNVVKLECKQHGGWRYETSDQNGNVVFQAHGVIHEFVPNRKIVRTFEMENAPFDVQIEFHDFEAISDQTSKLTIQTVFRSVELRDNFLKLPFAKGLNMAHDRLESIVSKLN